MNDLFAGCVSHRGIYSNSIVLSYFKHTGEIVGAEVGLGVGFDVGAFVLFESLLKPIACPMSQSSNADDFN